MRGRSSNRNEPAALVDVAFSITCLNFLVTVSIFITHQHNGSILDRLTGGVYHLAKYDTDGRRRLHPLALGRRHSAARELCKSSKAEY